MANENSKSLDLTKLWQDDEELRETLEKYVKICENCLYKFDQLLDHTSKKEILIPLQLIIRHLFVQTSLLYNGWKKSEENWIKTVNDMNRKTEQQDALSIYEWSVLKARARNLTNEENSKESSKGSVKQSKESLVTIDSVQELSGTSPIKDSGQNDVGSKDERKISPILSEGRAMSSGAKFSPFPEEKESTNTPTASQNTSQHTSKQPNNSVDNFCKCQCEDFQLSKHVVEILTSDCQCIVMNNVKPGKIGLDEMKQANKSTLSNSDYCQCCKCLE